MKYKATALVMVLLVSLFMTGCGDDQELTRFKTEIETFCTNISALDTSINSIDTSSDTFNQELLGYLDELELEFQKLAAIDFPEEFDYLENLAAEANEYMEEAVASYHEAFTDNSYRENIAEYAFENYSRAYKRVQIIIIYLHGEEPGDSDLKIE